MPPAGQCLLQSEASRWRGFCHWRNRQGRRARRRSLDACGTWALSPGTSLVGVYGRRVGADVQRKMDRFEQDQVILLDTHAVIWLFLDADQLSSHARKAIVQARIDGEELACSPVSFYEIANAVRAKAATALFADTRFHHGCASQTSTNSSDSRNLNLCCGTSSRIPRRPHGPNHCCYGNRESMPSDHAR